MYEMRERESPSCVSVISWTHHRPRWEEGLDAHPVQPRFLVFLTYSVSPLSSSSASPFPLIQLLTQSEFYEATWAVVNSPSTYATKWGFIEDWDTSNVTTFLRAFYTDRNEAGGQGCNPCNTKATYFNGDLSKWNTTSVKSLSRTFQGAAAFNSDVSTWITSSVTSMGYTFYGAATFNGDMSKWKTSSVINMRNTFDGAASFNGTGVDLWNINKVKFVTGVFDNANALTSCNKRKIADAWKSNAAFTATITDYGTDWAADTCSVR